MIEDSNAKLPLYVSNSGLTDFRRCPARYYFKHILGIEAKGSMFSALEYGLALHRAIPYVQRDRLNEANDIFRTSWKGSGCEEDAKRNLLNASKMLEDFHRKNIQGKQRAYSLIEPPPCPEFEDGYSDQEFAFCMHLSEHGIPFVGRIDGVGERNENGKIWGVEYKTTSEFGQRFLNSFEINSQILGYGTVLCLYYGIEQVEGFFLEAFRVTSKSPESYTVPIFIHETQVEMFIELFEKTLDEIVECVESGKFLQDVTACTTYNQHGSPGYLCEFSPLCKAQNEESFNHLIQGMYKKRRSSPFKAMLGNPTEKKV